MPWASPGLACVRDLPFFKAADDVLHTGLHQTGPDQIFMTSKQLHSHHRQKTTAPEGQRIMEDSISSTMLFPHIETSYHFRRPLAYGRKVG